MMDVEAEFCVMMSSGSYSLVNGGCVQVWDDAGYKMVVRNTDTFVVKTRTYFDAPLKMSVFAMDSDLETVRHVGNAVFHLADKVCGMVDLVFGTEVSGVVKVKYNRVADNGDILSKEHGIDVRINSFSFEHVIGGIHYWGLFFCDKYFGEPLEKDRIKEIKIVNTDTDTDMAFQAVLSVSRGNSAKYVPDRILGDFRGARSTEDPCVLSGGSNGDCEDSTRRFLVCITYFLKFNQKENLYVPCAVFCMCSSSRAGGHAGRLCGHACSLVLERKHFTSLLSGGAADPSFKVFLAETTNDVWGGGTTTWRRPYEQGFIDKSVSVREGFYKHIVFIVAQGTRYLVHYADKKTPADGVVFSDLVKSKTVIKLTPVDTVDGVYLNVPSVPWYTPR